MGKIIQHEKYFVKEFSYYCPMYGCLYVNYEDAIMTAGRLELMKMRGVSDEKKKQCDGFFVTPVPNVNLFLEFKYGTGQLRPHQKYWQDEINQINGSYFVLIKKELKSGTTYFIFKSGKLVHKNCSVKPLVQFLLNYAKTGQIPQEKVDFEIEPGPRGFIGSVSTESADPGEYSAKDIIIDEPAPEIRTQRINGEFKISAIDTGKVCNWNGMPVIKHDDEHYAVIVPKHWIDSAMHQTMIQSIKMED